MINGYLILQNHKYLFAMAMKPLYISINDGVFTATETHRLCLLKYSIYMYYIRMLYCSF